MAYGDTMEGPSEAFVNQRKWTVAGTVTERYAGAGEALDGESRSDIVVSAVAAKKIVIFNPKRGTVAVEMRYRSDGSEDDASTVHIYAAAGADHYTRMATHVITQGTQLYTGAIYFCDGIAVTNENWLTEAGVVQASPADNHIARYVFNPHGYDRFAVIVSTLATKTVYVDVRRL